MPRTILTDYIASLNTIFNTINPADFEDFVHELKDAYDRQANIFVCGNGGSASTASHFACDINKGVSYGQKRRFKIMCLNDNVPTMLAYANDVSCDDVFVEQLKNFMVKNDVIVGISGSGSSRNILKAIEYANNNGGRTFGICGFGGGMLHDIAQKSIIIKSNDMQKIEDMHMILLHCAMQWFIGRRSEE
jgi:D-sedoheptulose 7-phosphate isomerase